ncbi:MAG: M1 family metallopeptidase [Chitinophagales bacterium]|nr:M1 family metallopeptidase [Chitinophagales bacterium]
MKAIGINPIYTLIIVMAFGLYASVHASSTMATTAKRSAFLAGIEPHYDVKYYRLDLQADPAVHYIQGSVTTYFTVEQSGFDFIRFNLKNNMTVDSVKYHHNLLSGYSFIDDVTLHIPLPATIPLYQRDSITVYYQGSPIQDGYGTFTTSTTNCGGTDNKVLWTLSEPFGSKNWWPCKDGLTDKADTTEIIVTCPMPYRVGANGILIDSTSNPSNNTTTYRWKHAYPIPTYLVGFAIADYTSYVDKVPVAPGDTIEVLNYIYPCNTTARSQTPNLIPIFQYFNATFGEYPYKLEKYGHAQCGFGGGMEHSTMSFMGAFTKSLMAHELGHQWFGNKVTCGSWHDIWLNEGFAGYMEGLICEQGLGDQTWQSWKTSRINNVTSNNYGSTYVYDTTNINNIFNSRLVYNKGSLILHMLRWVIGDELFFLSCNNYLNDPQLAYNFATTSQFAEVILSTTGKDMTEYFNDWLYGEGWPNYNIEWTKDPDCNKVYVTINQSHSAGQGTFFEMPVPIAFSNGITMETVVFHQDSPEKLTFVHELAMNPSSATFDPEKWLCAKATVNQIPFNNRPRVLVWKGSVDNNWHNAANWDCTIPTLDDEVWIPEGTPTCKILPGMTGACRKLYVEDAASLILEGNAVLNVVE